MTDTAIGVQICPIYSCDEHDWRVASPRVLGASGTPNGSPGLLPTVAGPGGASDDQERIRCTSTHIP